MAINMIMKVLTSAGYTPMYPFNPSLVLSATVENTSTATQYNLTIKGVPNPLTDSFGNTMGIISFVPTINNGQNPKVSINEGVALPILFPNGTNLSNNILTKGRMAFIKYYNENFYLILDKSQVGLGNVDNTSDLDKPISTAMTAALRQKMNTPIEIPNSSNLNNFTTPGFFYTSSDINAGTIANSPTSRAFCLIVEKHIGTKQTLTGYTSSGVQTWVRNQVQNNWSSWFQQAFMSYGTEDPNNSIGAEGNLYFKYDE